jgi:hypothetical protein
MAGKRFSVQSLPPRDHGRKRRPQAQAAITGKSLRSLAPAASDWRSACAPWSRAIRPAGSGGPLTVRRGRARGWRGLGGKGACYLANHNVAGRAHLNAVLWLEVGDVAAAERLPWPEPPIMFGNLGKSAHRKDDMQVCVAGGADNLIFGVPHCLSHSHYNAVSVSLGSWGAPACSLTPA